MIKVILDRAIGEGFGLHYDTILQQSTALIKKIPGFLGCESLKDCNNPNHRVTSSLWDNGTPGSNGLNLNTARRCRRN